MEILKKLFRRPEQNSGVSAVSATGLRLSQNDRIRQMIRHELFRQAAGREKAETFEEADDFDLPDGQEWVSPYENDFDPPSETPPPPAETVPSPSPAPSETPPPPGDA